MTTKKIIFAAALLTLMLMLTGCDFFRTLAGRPTSAEIAAKKARIEAREDSLHLARIDSVKIIEKSMADSLAVLDSIAREARIRTAEQIGGEKYAAPKGYYIVVGAFSKMPNAERKLRSCSDAGYEGLIIPFKNGLNVVAICHSEALTDIYSHLKALSGNPICPKDAWILNCNGQ